MGLPKLLTIDQALAAASGLVSRTAIYAALRSGALASSKPARRRIIRSSELARWLGVPIEDLVFEPAKPRRRKAA